MTGSKLKRQHFGRRDVTKFDEGLALRILERVAEGESLRQILAPDDMPSRVAFWQWRMRYPKLQQAYEAARAISAESLEDEAMGIARDLVDQDAYTGTKVQALKVAIDQFRWSAGMRNPAQFGPKGDKASVVVPVQINTTLDLGGGASSEGVYNFSTAVSEATESGSGGEDVLDLTPEDEKKPFGDGNFKPRRPPGRPKGSRKGHKKTKRGIEATKRNYARRKNGNSNAKTGPEPTE